MASEVTFYYLHSYLCIRYWWIENAVSILTAHTQSIGPPSLASTNDCLTKPLSSLEAQDPNPLIETKS